MPPGNIVEKCVGLARQVADSVTIDEHLTSATKMTTDTRPKIPVNDTTLDQGNRICTRAVKRAMGEFTWISSNLPTPQRMALNAVLNHLIGAVQYLDLESEDGLSLDVWCELRDDLNEAFLDQYASPEWFALVHATRQYQIPKQYLFDILDGVDGWIRRRGFDTYEEFEVFAYRLGGAALTAAVPIVGFEKQGYEESAAAAGQAVFMTRVLANLVHDIKLNKIFVARQDIEQTELSISRIKVGKECPGFKNVVRLYGARIEKLMYRGGRLYEYLDFDARRCFKSLMAVHWTMLMKMRLNPQLVLDPDGILTRREMFGLKARHILGLEANTPIIPDVQHNHH